MHASSYRAMDYIASLIPSSRILDVGSMVAEDGQLNYRTHRKLGRILAI